jgi:hypothetical protein
MESAGGMSSAGRKTRALLWCAGALVAAELGLRALERPAAPPERLAVTEELAWALGTSRTMRALDPQVIEGVLGKQGITGLFAANVSTKAVTNVGLLRLWLEDVRPRLPEGAHGIVAIEVRCEGFNDSYLLDEESAWLELTSIPHDAPRWPVLPGFGTDRFCRRLLWHLRLSRPAEILDAWWAGLGSEGGGGGPPAWALDRRGFLPFENEPRFADLNREFWERHYKSKLLADYRFGGVQTDALVRLVAEVRRDGLVPALYTLPITDVQRGFFEPGDYAATLAHIRALAEREQVVFVDLDSDKKVPVASFQDTNHLAPEAARAMSTTFAKKVLAPLLRP